MNTSPSTVGVVVVLREAEDPIEDVLSARASGAIGGGLVVDKEVGLNDLDISLIPPNFVAESFGLEVGRGGGTIILVLCGVVGLAGGDTLFKCATTGVKLTSTG